MRLLIIGDLDGQIGAACSIARGRGAKVAQARDTDSALEMLRNGEGADLIMIDVNEDIAALTASLSSERIVIPVAACGVESDSAAAVKAIKSGAKEYVPLPPDEDLIAAVLEAITEESSSVIHGGGAMTQVLGTAEQIAQSDASVLITGESGTGKEVIARFIHEKSKRSKKAFISVNCAAIPENLLESELFGHEKGAFTGAAGRRIGKFEESSGGTLLLDEISEMDIKLQAKLLRAIQEKEIERIGSNKPVKVDLRILATSNRNLPDYVKEGHFREDLYFRLNVINVAIPSLRDRKEDIAPIAEFFIEKYSKANSMPPRPLADDALQKMMGYHWPGNVRELENTMHRAVLMAQGNVIDANAVTLQEAPETGSAGAEPSPVMAGQASAGSGSELVGQTVAEVEKKLIVETLDHCLGNRTQAANILGISIRTLRNKLKQYGDDAA